jgi:hypothetical protein
VADSMVIYLHIFQERLSCIRNCFQAGAPEAAGKDSHGICTGYQTCYNVVQPNLSGSGLGGHLCGGSWCVRDMYIFILWAHGTLIFIGCCSSPAQKT